MRLRLLAINSRPLIIFINKSRPNGSRTRASDLCNSYSNSARLPRSFPGVMTGVCNSFVAKANGDPKMSKKKYGWPQKQKPRQLEPQTIGTGIACTEEWVSPGKTSAGRGSPTQATNRYTDICITTKRRPIYARQQSKHQYHKTAAALGG